MWNGFFFNRLFGEPVWPGKLREWHDALMAKGKLPAGTYLEQFDVSFEYGAEMCAARAFDTCVFRRRSRIRDLCPPAQGADCRRKRCPVVAYLCADEYACSPEGCPVYGGFSEDLCPGCRLDVREGT